MLRDMYRKKRAVRGVVSVQHSVQGKCSKPCTECANALLLAFTRHGRGKMLRVEYTNAEGVVVRETLSKVCRSSKPSGGNKPWTFK
jgi:hypothetical protein